MKKSAIIIASLAASLSGLAADPMPYNAPNAGNPFIPGYFADPTVKKFGDDFYIYATTDGSGAGFGPAQLWTSKDFVNWTLMPMNWPDTHWIWAPDVMHNANDGLYYYLYCQPCTLHCGVSETPRGPWKNVLGKSDAVLVEDRFVTNAITLDGQTFVDDDGSIYMYWGTWGIYKGFGCGAGKVNPDMKGFSETRLIPNTEVKDFFEAPFVLKKDGKYYFMYSSDSCHDETYKVQYATADHPLGPYTYKGCILKSNEDLTVHGPGHHSILKDGNDYYIVYHRHDNPHSNRGFHRQICADKLEFDKDGSIKAVTPTHEGIGALGKNEIRAKNLAIGAAVDASSYYDVDFKPEYAVDNNYGTLWRPKGMDQEWITLDLGKKQNIKTIRTRWEYGTQFYQYLVETSADGKKWDVFSDMRDNLLAGSPMTDFGDANARYIRITYTGGEKNGFPGAIWDIEAYSDIVDQAPQQWVGFTGKQWNGLELKNQYGQLGGSFLPTAGRVTSSRIHGQEAITLAPNTTLTLANPVWKKDGKYTVTGWELCEGEWKEPHTVIFEIIDGAMNIRSTVDTVTIANVRVYNRELHPAEKAYDMTAAIGQKRPADTQYRGIVAEISADMFEVGDTVDYIPELHGAGYFEARKSPAIVEEIKGKKAFRFDGNQHFISSFPLPSTVRHNAPYTLEAWILNPEMAENECVADFTSSHDELEKIMLVNGTEPRCGVLNHYGWYEDAGDKDIKNLEGEWQHFKAIFDGRIERVFINDRLVSEKDIQLLVKPSQYISLGLNNEGEWPFTGYIHSILLKDEAE